MFGLRNIARLVSGMFTFFKDAAVGALDLFFPPTCLVCGAGIPRVDELLCWDCHLNFPFFSFSDEEENPMCQTLRRDADVQRAMSLMVYRKGNHYSRLVRAMKYHDTPHVAREMGRMLGEALQQRGFFIGITLVLPVPLHYTRQRVRGYNQSRYVAMGIADVTGLPVAEEEVFMRQKATKTQTALGLDARKLNVQDAFRVVCPDALQGEFVLLVDDVFTTGATLASCAMQLNRLRGTQVAVATVAYVQA